MKTVIKTRYPSLRGSERLFPLCSRLELPVQKLTEKGSTGGY
jgi:hypothetical protein